MKAFMVAIGRHAELAAITRPAFTWATGLECELVTDLGDAADPSSRKISQLSPEQHVVVDADLLFFRRATIPEVPLGVFAACPLQRYGRPMIDAAEVYGGGPPRGSWVNTGLFVADASHQRAMELAREWMRDGKQFAAEEGRLNCALYQLDMPIQRLAQSLNVQVMQNIRRASTVHCGCGKTFERKTRELHYYLQRHADPQLQALLRELGALGPNQWPVIPAPVRRANLRVGRNYRSA